MDRVHVIRHKVPCRWADLDLIARIDATTVTIVGRDGTAFARPRKRFGQRSIDYRHYLAELARQLARARVPSGCAADYDGVAGDDSRH